MPKVRNVKKDIDYLVGEVISDCYTYLFLHGEDDKEKIRGIIEELVNKRNDFIHRVNNPEKGLGKTETKKHFRGIYNDLLGAVDDSFTKLSELTKQ